MTSQRLGRVLSAVLVVSAVPLVILPASAEAKCGVHMEHGAKVHTYCGPAHVNFHATITHTTGQLSGGNCKRTTNAFKIDIGTMPMTTAQYFPPGFQLVVGRQYSQGYPASNDGTYNNDANVWLSYKGRVYYGSGVGSSSTVTLANNRTTGSFTAWVSPGGSLSGTFSCT